MRLCRVFFVMSFALSGIIFNNAFAGENDKCEEFILTQTGRCAASFFARLSVYGNNWQTRMTGRNPSEYNISFWWAARTLDGRYYQTVFFRDTGTVGEISSQSANHWLLSGKEIEVTFLSPMSGCNELGYDCSDIPAPETLAVGTIEISYGADGPEPLRLLPEPTIEIINTGGSVIQRISLARYRDSKPTWYFPAEEKFDGSTECYLILGNTEAENEMKIRGTVKNQRGDILGAQIWTLGPKAITGIYLSSPRDDEYAPGFGEDPFPDGNDFSGFIELEVLEPSGGKLTPMVLKVVGTQITNVSPLPGPIYELDVRRRTRDRQRSRTH